MAAAQPTHSREYLMACLAYCLTWELAGTRARGQWQLIACFVAAENRLNQRQRWMLELYEEGPPSAQEERSLRSQIEIYLLQPRDVAYIRAGILSLLPESLRPAAEAHSLMRGLSVQSSEYGKLTSWVFNSNRRRLKMAPASSVALAEREQEFNRFLELPYFVESFQGFWRVAPKRRSNRRTRVLLCLGAVMSQMVRGDDAASCELWAGRLAAMCHLGAQTKHDICRLMRQMHAGSYDVQELAYRLLVDARAIDQQNLQRFITVYAGQLSSYATELLRHLRFAAESSP